ncbi:MAG: hypothetical protein H0T42_03855 [Deltaproteobacteria bacterium]|nr:hypothetical protein [Deltaproteobacteria bacterium]
MERLHRWYPTVVFAASLVLLVVSASGGPGWDRAADRAVLAGYLARTASSPLYDALAGAAAHLPFGEVGFRLSVLGAVLGALTLAGVMAAVRALLPNDPLAGLIAAVILVLAPPFREATATSAPAMLAACGVVWSMAAGITHARTPSVRAAALALAAVGLVIGSAPWLGATCAVLLASWLARTGAARTHLAVGVGSLGILVVVLWIGASGQLPAVDFDLTAMVAGSGRGAGAIVVGAGLLGAAFAIATGLPHAGWLGLAILVTGVHAVAFDPVPAPLLAALAIGIAVIPSAIARAVPLPRTWVGLAAGLPLVAVAVLTGSSVRVDDPGDAPGRVATDVIDELPPGPGVIVATHSTVWSAIHYAQALAGARPDLRLVPPALPTVSDVVAADALRAKQIVGADTPAFGRLDPTRSVPRRRGFELRAEPLAIAIAPPPPAAYASAIGEELAVQLAVSRARFEAGMGRLDAAARAAGLTARFRAADLAVLATSLPTPERPALWAYIPRVDDRRPGPWLLELFGDDLAWVAGIPQPVVDGPPARRLHALWRELLQGKRTPDDPEIAAFGPAAVAATAELMTRRP